MDDSVIWAVALGSGVLALLLFAVAGVAAMCLNTGVRRAKDAASADKSQPHAGDAASTGKSQSRAQPSNVQSATGGGSWTWVKACIFALVHAGTVSFVLGGITLFEDLAKASDEIQRTGTVTFPKQLLPGTLSIPASRKRLGRPSGDSSNDDQRREAAKDDGEAEGTDQPGASPPNEVGWAVVDMVNETCAGGDS